MNTMQVLLCKCGACAHWEIVETGGKHFLVCMTCNKQFHVNLSVPASEHLEWADIDSDRKKWHAHD